MTSMNLPQFTMRQLLEAGVHYGHKTSRWNPKMEPYIFGVRQGIHILDLRQTVPLLHQAMSFIADVVQHHGRVLFVGTTSHASQLIAEQAKRCGQYFVNRRWLGGMLTNWETISKLIRTLDDLEKKLAPENHALIMHYTKKELLQLKRHHAKLLHSIGGIRSMGGRPDAMFVVDTNKEELALSEARKLNIPILAVLDSNSNPDGIAYPIPGNDDSTRAISLYTQLIADAALVGLQHGLAGSGLHLSDVVGSTTITSEDLAYESSLGTAQPTDAGAQPAGDAAPTDAPIKAAAPQQPARARASTTRLSRGLTTDPDGPMAIVIPRGSSASGKPSGDDKPARRQAPNRDAAGGAKATEGAAARKKAPSATTRTRAASSAKAAAPSKPTAPRKKSTAEASPAPSIEAASPADIRAAEASNE